LKQLQHSLEKALTGKRQLVFVTGEPGIGKTALVDTFLLGAAVRLHIARGQCIEHYGAGEAYLPVLEALEGLCRRPGHERLVQLLRQHAPLWLAQMPALLNSRERVTLQQEVQGATRERMLREIVAFVEVLTSEVPLVLWLEDLHWCDPSTLDLIAMLARRREPARLLIISSYRSGEVLMDGHPLRAVQQELQGHGLSAELPLQGLGESAVHEYLAVRFAGETHDSVSLQQLVQILYQRTEGNPLFLVAVVDDWVSRGLITQCGGSWMIQSKAESLAMEAPESLRRLMEKQGDRLSQEDQRLLAAASVAGAEFSAAAVAAALRRDVIVVEERCATLTRSQQFLRPVGVEEWPDGTRASRYGFRHALYQHLWHERVTIGRRQQIHRRIGVRKETAYGKQVSEIAAELAVHFEEGRDYLRAVRYHAQTADNAIRRHAGQEAVQHLTRALELLQTLPDTPQRAQQELLLQSHLRVQIGRLRGEAAPELGKVVTRIEELSLQVEETPQLFWTLTGAYLFYVVSGALHTAQTLAERHLRMAQRFPDPLFTIAASTELGIVSFFLGEFAVAREHLDRAITLYDPKPPHPFFIDWEHGPPCFSYAAFVLWFLGYPDQARQWSAQALARAQELCLPYMTSFALNCAAMLHQLRGERSAMQERADTAMQIGNEHGFAGMVEMGRVFYGRALAERGRHSGGISQLLQGSVMYRALGGGDTFPVYYQALLAEAYCRNRQFEEGSTALDEALAITERTGGRYYEAELHRLKGELSLRLGQSKANQNKSAVRSSKLGVPNPKSLMPKAQHLTLGSQAEAEAEAYFHKAIGVARRQKAKSLELRATTSLSRLWLKQGKKGEAYQRLTEIYDWFTEGFDTADLKEAKALLDELA
jgi:predicted ATPase